MTNLPDRTAPQPTIPTASTTPSISTMPTPPAQVPPSPPPPQTPGMPPTTPPPPPDPAFPLEPIPQPGPPPSSNNFIGMAIGILVILTLIGGGIAVYQYYQISNGETSTERDAMMMENVSPTPATQDTTPPQVTDTPEVKSHSPEQLVVAGLYLPIGTWTPIISPTNTPATSTIYLGDPGTQSNEISECIESQACDGLFMLEISGGLAVPNNVSFTEYISNQDFGAQMSTLTQTTIDGKDAWTGRINDTEHQAVIKRGTETTIATIVNATAPAEHLELLGEYETYLDSAFVSDESEQNEIDPANAHAYVVTLTSSLETSEYSQIQLVLQSFLIAGGDRTSYTYKLLTASEATETGAAGISYPSGDFLNYSYYLLTDNPSLTSGTYGTDQVSIELVSMPDRVPYLSNPSYCEQDTDCMYRSNFCTIDTYNPYHAFFTPWGCGPGDLAGFGNTFELSQELQCTNDVKVAYDAMTCVQNACQFVNPEVVCQEAVN